MALTFLVNLDTSHPAVKRATQLSLAMTERPRWGGGRSGAGRKPRLGRRPGVPHRPRPAHRTHEPVLVTMRAAYRDFSLRASAVFGAIRSALNRASSRGQFRVVHFSIQTDHLHLIVEADDASALTSGMRGLTTRLALAINRALGHRGRVLADRYHARALTTPKAVRAALVYVLANSRKHLRVRSGLDPCSSARSFDGFADRPPESVPESTSLPPPRTWLLRIGWRRHGLLSTSEGPAPHMTRTARGECRTRVRSDIRSAVPEICGASSMLRKVRHQKGSTPPFQIRSESADTLSSDTATVERE